MMSQLKVYWKSPFKGASPREWLNVRGAGGNKIKAPGVQISPGVMEYTVPDTEDNRILISGYGEHFTDEKPELVNPKSEKKVTEQKPEKKPAKSPTRRLTKIEVMDMLSKAGIKYRTNEKPETLFRKLPDDVRRNFKLDQP